MSTTSFAGILHIRKFQYKLCVDRNNTQCLAKAALSLLCILLLAGCPDMQPDPAPFTGVLEVIEKYQPREFGVQSLAYSPDGSVLVTGTNTGFIHIWNTNTGVELGSISFTETCYVHDNLYSVRGIRSLSFSPNGRLLAVGRGDQCFNILNVGNISDPKTWESIQKIHAHPKTYANNENPIPLDSVYVAFSSDSSKLASGGTDEAIKIWNITNWESPEKTLTRISTFPVASLAWQPNNNTRLALGSSNTIRIWNLVTSVVAKNLDFGEVQGSAFAFSPDGTKLAYSNKARDQVRILNTTTLNVDKDFSVQNVDAIAYSPDGSKIAYIRQGDPQKAVLINASTGSEIKQLQGNVVRRRMAFSPDGRQLAAAGTDNTVSIWSVE